MFADDTIILNPGKTNCEIQQRVNAYLENLFGWLLSNKRTLNKQKNGCMIISSQKRISSIKLTRPKIELGESGMKKVHKSNTSHHYS